MFLECQEWAHDPILYITTPQSLNGEHSYVGAPASLYKLPMQNFMLNQPYSMYNFGWCNLEMDAWINHEMDAWVNLN